MAFDEFSGLRWKRTAWLALPACALALGSAHRLFDSNPTTTPAEERLSVESVVRPAEGILVSHATTRNGALAASDAPQATAPRRSAEADGVVRASALRELPEFSSRDDEITFLRARLPGAKLEQKNWTRSLAAMKSAVEQATSSAERAELERRAARLETKLGHQDSLVVELESRIDELERSGSAR
jgi:hypothetical protein